MREVKALLFEGSTRMNSKGKTILWNTKCQKVGKTALRPH